MTETTRFVSKTTAAIMLAIALAGVALLFGWANERYALEVQRECMSNLSRPDPNVSDYEDKMFEFTAGVRACIK